MTTASTEAPPAVSSRALGGLLRERGVVDEASLSRALDEQRRTGERIGRILVRGGADPEQVAMALADQLRLTHAAGPLEPEPEALALVPRALALRLRAVPLSAGERRLRVAMADPLDVGAIDDLQFQTGRPVEPVVATAAAVDRALMSAYGGEAVHALVARMGADADGRAAAADAEDEIGALRRASEAAPVIALVDLVLARAVAARASDIHIGTESDRLTVRVRSDGALSTLLELPRAAALPLVSRIKIMAGLDIAVKRVPQDGRCAVRVEGRELAVRVSTLPANRGESVVLRLLHPDVAARGLDELGLGETLADRLREIVHRDQGLFLVTGPTGSGKTTTLYAILRALDRARRNVVTLEDPVEYRLEHLTQVQVRPRAGLTFATALRAVLRQDPDVIMVGEIRDRETAQVALAAALTGHLVLSTLHTIDAPGAVGRLLEMGAPAYLVAGGLTGVLAQRLARRLCGHCRKRRPIRPEEDALLGGPGADRTLFDGAGCRRCEGRGYRGRIGVFELLTVDVRVRERIVSDGHPEAIREAAAAQPTPSLVQDARAKVLAGHTTIEEVRPVLALDAIEHTCTRCSRRLRPTFRVCPGCGAPARPHCGCGQPIETGWRHCVGCGAAVEDA